MPPESKELYMYIDLDILSPGEYVRLALVFVPWGGLGLIADPLRLLMRGLIS